jgi:hypothetical protein
MPKNTESLNRSLFDLLHSKGLDPTMLSTAGKEIPTPEEAEVFQFNFVKDGEDYGTVTISIDGLHKLTVYFGDEVANSEKEELESDDISWYQLLNQLKKFSQKYQLSFELRNLSNLKHDMAKREYMKKKESIQEGYYPMGRKASYSDAVPSVKIVLQHSRQIEEGEQRYRNVERIFLENEQGERFLAPTTRPGIARVYARHIAEGGMPHDERWNHIGSLCEEYSKMAGFVRATRSGQFTESTQKLIAEGINHYQSLRESLSKLAGHRGYNAYFESWSPPLMEDDSDMSNINELFVQETVDPRIESVMPILSKLQKKISEMSEVSELSEWADKLIEGDEDIEDDEADDAADNAEEDLTEAPGAETLGHNVRTDAKNLRAFDLEEEESLTSNNPQGVPESAEDNPVAGAITRRILSQRLDLLKKYGPVKVAQAIDNIADFVGDTEEIGSSDVSGWIKQIEQTLGGVDEGMMDTIKKVGSKVFDKLGGGSEEDLLKDLQKKAGIPAHAQHGKPNMAQSNEKEVDESALQAYLGDKKYGKDGMDALRKAGQEHASEKKMQNIRAKFSNKEEVAEKFDPLKHIDKDKQTLDIKKAAKDVKQGSYAYRAALMKAGGVKDDRGPRGVTMAEGEGNFAKAIENLHGWSQHDSSDPNVEVFDFDDGEGGYYAQGTVEHNLKTGEITVDFEDTSGEYGGGSIKEKFNSIGDAMNVLRRITTQMRYNSGRKPNFDTLGGTKLAGPDDLYKTDKAGKKGTLTKARMDRMKMSSPYNMRGGPKGVLPEGQEDLDTIKRLLRR